MSASRITGTWIDVVHPCPRDGVYWNRKTLAYSAEEWRVLVRHLAQDLGIEMVTIQCVVKDGLAVYPSRFLGQEAVETRWYTRNCHDPLDAIVRACTEFGVRFYMGVGMLPGEFDSGAIRTGPDVLDWYRSVSEELLDRYSRMEAFRGWYMSAEMSIADGNFQPHQIDLTSKLTAMWNELTPGWPTVASPYFCPKETGVLNCDANARLLDQSGLTAVAYQDGIGVSTAVHVTAPPDPERNARIFSTARALHDRTDVELWGNVEIFSFENDIFFQPLIPAPFERVSRQIEHAAPHVDRLVSYTVPGLMTSQEVCPGLGVPDTERLYRAYRNRYLNGGHGNA